MDKSRNLGIKVQYPFAFEWEAPGEKHQQMTWTVFPQGFKDSPHLFGQAFSWDLLDLDVGIIICVQITSPGLMHETGCSGLVHWDDPEG